MSEAFSEVKWYRLLYRDAEDAVRGRDGYDFDGYRIRVEFPRLSSKGGGHPQRRGGGRGSMPMRDRGGMRKGFQCLVTNLPPTGSWQDLKDHFREAGDVTFTDVFRDGTGIVEFARFEHMKRAVRDLDDSKFRSHEVCIVTIAMPSDVTSLPTLFEL